MKDIKVILFDIDGTLLDTTEFILQPTEYALRECGYPVPDRSIIKKLVGIPFPDYYVELSGSALHVEKMVQVHRDFQAANFGLAQIFPGSLETLQELKKKGYKMAAITSRGKRTAHQSLVNAGIRDFFDVLVVFEDTEEKKPHPAPLFKALEDLHEVPEHAVMIGDSHFDIEAGKAAGTKTIRATYGFHADHLHDPEPDFVIQDITDLLKIL